MGHGFYGSFNTNRRTEFEALSECLYVCSSSGCMKLKCEWVGVVASARGRPEFEGQPVTSMAEGIMIKDILS